VQQLGAIDTHGQEHFEKSSNNGSNDTARLPECPAEITADGETLRINPAPSINSSALAQEPRQI
jgi:hypothetical protein